MVGFSEKVSDKLAGEGIGVDLLDLRTTSPLDEEAILDSVEATGRLVIVDESPPRCSLASDIARSEEHTSELQSLMRISYAVFCLKKKTKNNDTTKSRQTHDK